MEKQIKLTNYFKTKEKDHSKIEKINTELSKENFELKKKIEHLESQIELDDISDEESSIVLKKNSK